MELEAVTATRRMLRTESGSLGTPDTFGDDDVVGLRTLHRASPTALAHSVAGAAAAHEEHLDTLEPGHHDRHSDRVRRRSIGAHEDYETSLWSEWKGLDRMRSMAPFVALQSASTKCCATSLGRLSCLNVPTHQEPLRCPRMPAG